MTKEEVEKFGTLKAVFNAVSEVLNNDNEPEQKELLIKKIHLYDGKNEYTKMFFPTDKDTMAIFKDAKSSSELDKGLDELPDVPVRSWLEACCAVAWNQLNGCDSKR